MYNYILSITYMYMYLLARAHNTNVYVYMYHYVSTYVLYVNWLYIYTNIHVYTWDETWRNIINFIFDG